MVLTGNFKATKKPARLPLADDQHHPLGRGSLSAISWRLRPFFHGASPPESRSCILVAGITSASRPLELVADIQGHLLPRPGEACAVAAPAT
jgi:hypothetical protein